MTDKTIDVKTEDNVQVKNGSDDNIGNKGNNSADSNNGNNSGNNNGDNNGSNKGKNNGVPDDIPEIVWNTYVAAFMEFLPNEPRKPIKSCERQIGQLERRISRKKGQENHQILADMKDLHRRTAAIGYTVAVKEGRLRKRFRHTLRMLIRLDISFLQRMTGGANPEDIMQMQTAAVLLRGKSLYEIYKEDYMQYLVGQRIEELMEAEPEKQYPEARGMKRHFILHIGPTNSGKTYQALQRLKQ
ncbi:MAG: hypothetical protein K2N77_14235, partial [Lachnospiraceae bacterium]|nr:hypothetical protein [Lachnospiraceae bacterium]